MASLQRTDILLNEDGDFPLQDTISNGIYLDTPVGASDLQHMRDLIVYDLGWLSSRPTIGFGVNRYLNSEFNLQDVENKIRKVFKEDGYSISNGIVSPVRGGGFIINVEYASRI